MMKWFRGLQERINNSSSVVLQARRSHATLQAVRRWVDSAKLLAAKLGASSAGKTVGWTFCCKGKASVEAPSDHQQHQYLPGRLLNRVPRRVPVSTERRALTTTQLLSSRNSGIHILFLGEVALTRRSARLCLNRAMEPPRRIGHTTSRGE